jgi:hypothetical protein
MSVLDPGFFGGASEVDGNDLARVKVANFNTDVEQALHVHYDWKKTAIGVIGLSLSHDHLRVASGTFTTRGSLDLEDKKIAANFIWPTARANVTLVLKFPAADAFTFEESGGLWSNILSDNEVSHAFFDSGEGRGGQALLDTDERRQGTHAGFSLRMLAQISTSSSSSNGVMMNYIILLFPARAEDLKNSPESKFAGWPGLKVAEGTFPLGPAPGQPWQCPVLPFIKPVTAFWEVNVVPTSDKLRDAVASIMYNSFTADMLKVSPV